MIGRPLSPVSFAGARRRGRRRGLAVGAAVGASAARSRGNQTQAQAEPEEAEAPPQVDTATQLQKLADLKNQGVLTEEEFAAEKAKILG